jgi:hypothetical protein
MALAERLRFSSARVSHAGRGWVESGKESGIVEMFEGYIVLEG